ncbi:DUF433 domain-containing protein [Thermus altitudinis]|uniref:DUF433 domain-containing protein n=1 Tax=Thermus altitudinis TaxID=2908145 RepID=UPI001FAAD4FF|nr:DUF433 domain-containing protein [Thermus altitudinis]
MDRGKPKGAEPESRVLSLDPRDRPLYTLREAARYLGIPVATLRTWVRGRSYTTAQGARWSEPLITPPEEGHLLSFHNLVEANVLAALREVFGVSMAKIRRMVKYAMEHLGVARPLLLDLKAGLGDIFVRDPQGLLSLSRSGQLALEKILESYLARVHRDARGRPLRFHPPVADQIRSNRIVLDPQVAFGAPTVKSIRTRIIALRYDSGETPTSLAEDYGISVEDVKEAILFEGRAA